MNHSPSPLTLPELPEPPVNDARCMYDQQHAVKYTAAQMLAFATEAVLAERERCAKVCEAQYEPYNDSYHDQAVQQCVNAIRKG